ncbi:MAG: type II toxin-antitoxin system RelE/ParE family toxin [Candidatus Hydrogenedentales bacterium]|jgi:toxin ParE1/3/4
MSAVTKTPQAELDLMDIWEFIAVDSESAADRLLREIARKSVLLASTPQMGRGREELASGMRSFPVGKYMLYYRIRDAHAIEIVRVLHAARDVEAAFDDE